MLDRERVVRYHGRIDDQYGVGYSRSAPEKQELANAIEQLIADERVTLAETEVIGCHIGRVKPISATGEIIFSKHIAPIFNVRCVKCHREQ